MKFCKWHTWMFLLIMWPLCAPAQRVEVSVNRNNIYIGEQVDYGLKVIAPGAGYKVHFLLPDSVPHFEILKKGPVAELKSDPPALEQVITFTSFDSGSWVFPAVPVLLSKGDHQLNLQSSSVLIQVGYSPQDTTGIYDIRGMHTVPLPDYFWYYVALGILIALLLGWLLYRYYKRRTSKAKPLYDAEETPLAEAIAALNALLQQMPASKELHTTTAETGKRFLSRKWQKDVMHMTTGELLLEFSKRNGKQETITELASLFRLADAVKFARFVPPREEDKESIRQWTVLVNKMDQEILTRI